MSKVNTDPQKIEALLKRGVEEVIKLDHLRQRLLSGERLRVKLGIDPTSPNIHLGRSIPLLKLRDFQELGHQVVFIVGDFTGVIGDTSDKDAERPMLTPADIKKNMKDYVKQAGKIIDLKKCEVHYNSQWLKKLSYAELGAQADQFSVAEFSARENIKKRLDAGKRVSFREMLYPLMQAYDSVMVKADVELGGTDQRFNLLAGRELQKHYQQNQQDVIMGPLLEGTDGRKMSSSWDNTVNLTDAPSEMFGKIMTVPDNLIMKYFILATRVDLTDLKGVEAQLLGGANPRYIKALLAKEIVKMYHGDQAAVLAEEAFNKQFTDKELPEDIEEKKIELRSWKLDDLLVELGLTSSKTEARRLIEQGGVKIDSQKTANLAEIQVKSGIIVQVGKRKFARIK
ncbi:MAG: tyrosine--tRNA ligase [Candidatus Komeilibacteria bacterium]|nr:tyrosine--tRNA ligase [Candidatus Komeilibacteria bacterium]